MWNKAWQQSPCSVVGASICAALLVLLCTSVSQAQQVNSSPNVVGSGARALGMGGAFIAIADDATAASWNPGGLTQLERPEVSLVYNYKFYSEDFRAGQRFDPMGMDRVDFGSLNYFSIAYPFQHTLNGRNVVISLNYQRKYDFNRNLDFSYRILGSGVTQQGNIAYRQTGSLSALSPAFGIELNQKLSVGMVVNLWDHHLVPDNEWKEEIKTNYWSIFGALPTYGRLIEEKRRDRFKGINYTFGVLYKPNDRWSFGAVYHTAFAADIRYTLKRTSIFPPNSSVLKQDRRIEFPCAYGVGISYRGMDDRLTLSLDVTRRQWDQFVEVQRGNLFGEPRRISPITNLPKYKSPHKPTYTVRFGAEYVFFDPTRPMRDYLPSLRVGFFYDPEPSGGRKVNWIGLGPVTGKPDDYYGVTLGAGILYKNRVNIDFAYQYRWGNDVRTDTFSMWDVKGDVSQHDLYISTVVYF